MKEKAVVQGFANNTAARHRKGVVWHVLFQASTVVGVQNPDKIGDFPFAPSA